jgi:hypothetical protein
VTSSDITCEFFFALFFGSPGGLTLGGQLKASDITLSKVLTRFLFRHQVKHFLDNEAKGTNIIGATSMEDMVSKLKSPRRVMLLVKGKVRSALVGAGGVSEWKITVSR